MSKNKKQSLSGDDNITFDIDEEDDIYLPDNIFAEIKFIFFMLNYIIFHPSERQNEWKNLCRQVAFFVCLMKNK